MATLVSPTGDTAVPDGAIDIGESTWIIKVLDPNGHVIGIDEFHINPATGEYCGGWVAFEVHCCDYEPPPAAAKWRVESWEPLTLSPSILCTACKHHGYIREGRWVPA